MGWSTFIPEDTLNDVRILLACRTQCIGRSGQTEVWFHDYSPSVDVWAAGVTSSAAGGKTTNQYRPQCITILIMGTPKKVPLIVGNPKCIGQLCPTP